LQNKKAGGKKMNNDIIDILNNDNRVRKLMQTAQKAAIKQGMTEQEWQKGKKDLLYLAIAICPEAMDKLANEVYQKILI